MARLFIFTDEAGCFTFTREPNVSRYFVLCTVVMRNCEVLVTTASLRDAE